MKIRTLLGTSLLAMTVATPAFAQSSENEGSFAGDIVVTAQRQSESLQEVPIAVSAFSAESLEKQQIENSSDLQLTLPNVTFTKTNFTSSSFTIRGIGDLCVGVSCDSATAIHINGSPLLGTRLFETEFFDLERIEVLRGPQGTLFGRNATSGVVNLVTAKPDLSGFGAAGEFEYGNFNSIKAKGMVNAAITDTLGVRVAGFYLKRDGYTENLGTGNDVDDRDMYAVRGSLRWQPTDTTTIDLMGYYFRENDKRSRIQKQLCRRDPTGVLGCLPSGLDSSILNGNATFPSTLGSREFLAFNGIPTAFGLGSIYGPDIYSNFVQPRSKRQIRSDYDPTYFSSEEQYQARIEQELGPITLQVTGLYQKARVDSTADYNLAISDRSGFTPALTTLAAAAAGLVPGLPAAYFRPFANGIIPNGPGGQLCTSQTDPNQVGVFGGAGICAATPLDFDRSEQSNKSWSVEGIVSSDFDGMFNFLLGGIYVDGKTRENSYYVNSFGIDYVAGLLGAFNSFPAGLPPSVLGPPMFRNHTPLATLKSYGIFGEGYFEFSDALKLTVGLRYNNDKKQVTARSTLAAFLVPYGTTSAFNSPLGATFDADASTICPPGSPVGAVGSRPGCEAFQVRRANNSEWTGRAVLDYQISDDNLVYLSYSRGYKSGGINPPLQPIFAVPDTFGSEKIDSFEIGSKNVFGNGQLVLNLTGFYYKYSDLQLSRIVARTAVNDNVSAKVWGVEVEAIARPDPAWTFNLGFSYLKTKVSEDKFLSDPRDPSGGRADAVIIKDISNGAHCAVVPRTAGNAAGSNGFVTVVNNIITTIGATRPGAGGVNAAPLRGPTGFGPNSGVSATGAFSLCQVLDTVARAGAAALNPAFAAFQPTINSFGGIDVLSPGVAKNIRGNELPQAPNFKFSIGGQYEHEFASGMTLTPRVDLTYTGNSYGAILNDTADRIEGFTQANAQIQLDGPDRKWYVRGFVQNIFDSASTTGLYVTDASSGLFTNIFTLEPRRYGLAAGFRF